jgi:iron complex outermembrane receptor protein
MLQCALLNRSQGTVPDSDMQRLVVWAPGGRWDFVHHASLIERNFVISRARNWTVKALSSQALLKMAAAPAVLGFALLSSTAYAQEPQSADTAAEGDVIIVTGSRISRERLDTTQPTVVIGAETIEDRGLTNIGDALDSIPSFGTPSSSAAGTQAGSFGSGQTFVNYFGLGSQRTLTLVNGRRFVSSNTASIFGPTDAGSQVDLNTIPSLMVDRIETVAVGGAPIYGSDAIAGTVNIILKDKFQGLRLDAQSGISREGDAAEYRLGAMAGTSFAGGRGNIVAAVEYNKSEGLLYTDRKATSKGLYFAAPSDADYPFQNQLIENRRISIMSDNGIPFIADSIPGFGEGIYNAAGEELAFDRSGKLIPIDFGTPTGGIVDSSGGNGFSLLPVSNLRSPVERYLGSVQANFEVTDNVRAFAEFAYARSTGTELRSQPVYNTWLFDDAGDPSGNLIVPLSNPFLNAEDRATIAQNLDFDGDGTPDQDYFYLGRANTDLYSGLASSKVELYRIVGGFDGEFQFGDRSFTWELSGNYGRSKTTGSGREVVHQNFLNALDGCPAGAVNSPIATISSTCAAFNPFGQQNSQAVQDYITTVANPTAVNEQWVVSANVAGDLFSMWAGDVGVALGYEHRDEKARFDPGAFFFGAVDPTDPDGARTSYGRSVPIDPVAGGYNTDEVYGELRVPLVSADMAVPFINLLEFSGAARYVHNSLAGGDVTWTAGGRWQPVDGVTVRGNYTKSIRSPAVTELFNPTSQIYTTADDPCDARFLSSGPNPATRQANCAADGLPANFVSTIVDATTEGSLSGNTNLKNEKADSWTAGVILTPRFMPGFSLSVDWVSIKLKDAILSVDADQTMEACYDSSDFPNDSCSQITRDANGQVEYIKTGYLNAASYSYQGIVADLRYRFATPFLGRDSNVTLRGSYQYIDKLEQSIGLGDRTTLRNGIGYAKHQATVSANYNNGPFDYYLQAEYTGPTTVDPDAAANAYDYFNLKNTVVLNTSVSVRVQDKFRLRFIVDNLLDTDPPFPVPAGGGIVSYFDHVMGRYFKVAATIDF